MEGNSIMSDENVSRRSKGWLAKVSYALFDVGNSAGGAIHATFIFAVYFTTTIAPENGTAYWGYMTAAASLTVALIGPILGGFADSRARRKLFLAITVSIGTLALFLLWQAKPTPDFLWIAIIFSFFTIVASELMFVFYNALLSSVATEENMGRISGWSWGVGYFGAIIALAIALFVFIKPDLAPFGLDKGESEHVRATMVLAGLFMLIFSLPLFFFVKESAPASKLNSTVEILKTGWTEIIKVPGLARFLLARMFYVDGLSVIFAFAGIFAAKVFGFSNEMVLYFAIAVNFTCGVGAMAGGWFDDRYGSFNTIRVSLLFMMVLGLGVLLSPNAEIFWALGLTMGLFIGPIQAASRSLVSRVSPEEHRAQIFGFYMLSGKITSFFGPLIYASLILWTNNERAGMVTAVVFFVVGFIILGKSVPGKVQIKATDL
jgi:UMF1 family MFS transporter